MAFKRTARGTTILLLSATFITFGLIEPSETTIVLVYAGIGLFLYYYTSKLLLQTKTVALDKLKVSRQNLQRVSEDKTIDVSLTFSNETFIGLQSEVFDNYPPFLRLKSGSNTAIVGIPGKGYSTITYTIRPTSIGSHEFGPVHLVTRDLAGLFFYERNIEKKQRLEIIPRGREISRGTLAAATLSTYAGPLTSRRKGEGMEFADIREYNFGDPYKRIEWKSTARTGQLMVRELHAETQLNVMIILQSTDSMAYGEAGQTKLDYAARAVASLVAYLSRRGDFFGLTLIQGKSFAQVLPLDRGQLQINKVLSLLSRLEPAWTGREAVKEAVRSALRRGRIKDRTLFFVLTDLESTSDLGALKQLIAMSHEVVIISPFTPLFEAHGLKGLDRMVYSIRTSYQWRTRQEVSRQASSLGIPLFDVGPADMFPQLVLRVEEHRRRGGS